MESYGMTASGREPRNPAVNKAARPRASPAKLKGDAVYVKQMIETSD